MLLQDIINHTEYKFSNFKRIIFLTKITIHIQLNTA